MNGSVIHNTPIAVDMWKPLYHPSAKLFFLSHMHGDHTAGLTATWKDTIYCSEVTGRLLHARLGVQKHLIHTLEVNESHLLPLDREGKEMVAVMLIDANHCPGAVMFLFQGYFGNILYTGDFRYDPTMFTHSPLAQHLPVDILYLDNTYNNPKCIFPSREEATKEIVNLIRHYPNHDILLGMNKLGKENLFVEVAKQLKEWIVVTEDKYRDFELLELPDVFTCDKSHGRIRIVQQFEISKRAVGKMNRHCPTIAILATSLYTGTGLDIYSDNDFIFIINYSDHSSYRELHEFVSRVRPRKIEPVVQSTKGVFNTDWSDRANMKCFEKYLDPTPSTQFNIPSPVKHYMVSALHIVTDSSARHSIAKIKQYKLARARSYPRTKRKPQGMVFSDSPSNDHTNTHILFHDTDSDSGTDGQTSSADIIEINPTQNAHSGIGTAVVQVMEEGNEHDEVKQKRQEKLPQPINQNYNEIGPIIKFSDRVITKKRKLPFSVTHHLSTKKKKVPTATLR